MAKGTLNIVIAGDATKLNKALAASEHRMRKFGRSMQTIGDGIFRTIGLPFIAAGAAGVKAATDFESSMSKIKGLVGITGDEFKQLEQAALRLGPQMGKSANEAAQALFFITSAGLKGSDAIETLEASLKASAAGLGETKVVADLATSAMNAYGSDTLSAAQATDILTAAVREGKLEADTLAGSMGRVLPIASAMGVQFNEVGAAFAAMSRTGTNADEAATQLKAILTTIAKPAKQAEDEMSKLGLSSIMLQNSLRRDGLLATLEILNDKFKGNTAATAAVFGNVRALTGVLDLMGKNADGTAEIFDRMASNAGDTDKAFKAAAETTEFKFKVALAKLNAAAIDLGRYLIPIVTKAIGVFQNLISSYMRLDSGTKQSIINTLKWTTILSGGMSVIGRIVNGLASLSRAARMLGLTKVFANAVSSLRNLGSTLTNVTKIFTPQGAIIAGMVVVTLAIIKNWDKVKTNIVKAVNRVIDLYNNSKLVRVVFEGLEFIVKGIVLQLKLMWNLVKNIGSGLFGIVEGIVTLDFDRIEQAVADAGAGIRDSLKEHFEQLKKNYDDAKKDIEDNKLEYITEEDIDKAVNKGKDMFGRLQQEYKKLMDFFSGRGGAGSSITDATSGAIASAVVDRVAKIGQASTRIARETDISKFLPKIVNRNKNNELGLMKFAEETLLFADKYKEVFDGLKNTVASFFDFKNAQLEKSYQLELAKIRQSAKNEEHFTAMKEKLDERYDKKRSKLQRKQAVAQKLASLFDIAINTASAVMATLGKTGFFGIPLSGVVAGIGAAQAAIVAATPIPAMAEGGIISGRTLIEAGEYSGARVNPEVIAPLDKLKSMMGNQNVNVTGQFRVRGSDLVLVLERENRQLEASRGYGLTS